MEGLLTAAVSGITGMPATTEAGTGITGAIVLGLGTIMGIHTGDGGQQDGRSSTGGLGDILTTGIRAVIPTVVGPMGIVRGGVLTIILKIMNVTDIARTLDTKRVSFPGTPYACA